MSGTRCFPSRNRFSVQDQPFDGEEIWDETAELRWCAFLRDHPECFDSLDILDDLATAIGRHPQAEAPGLDDLLLSPLLARNETILECACRKTGPLALPWAIEGNRPALRGLGATVSTAPGSKRAGQRDRDGGTGAGG